MAKAKILKDIRQAILNLSQEKVVEAIKRGLEERVPPTEMVEEGIAKGLRKVGKLFEKGEFFLPRMAQASEVAEKGLALLEPILKKVVEGKGVECRVLLCTVREDQHDIGKDIVKILLEGSGFEVFDLGVDVPTNVVLEKVKELEPEVLCVSAFMTSTMPEQERLIELLNAQGLHGKVKVVVGGAPVTRGWAKKIGADGWAGSALDAIKIVKKLCKKS